MQKALMNCNGLDLAVSFIVMAMHVVMCVPIYVTVSSVNFNY